MRRFTLGAGCAIIVLSLMSMAGDDASAARTASVKLEPVFVLAGEGNEAIDALVADSLLGRSGKLRARLLHGPLPESYPSVPLDFGVLPGVYPSSLPRNSGTFNFIVQVPFARKSADKVGSYMVGYWPGEFRFVADEDYGNPDGFIEVTPENELTRVSEHFVLRDFVTHDRQTAWPRYVVLQEALLDKLELVLSDLERQGLLVINVRVLSGFRTPYHNQHGLGGEGGARDSRHQFGDAADIIIDSDHDGRMDDLNRDRKVDSRDLDLILRAVERVERQYPDLVGGLGSYQAMGPSGPFAHIDVRGHRARWSNGRSGAATSAKPAAATRATEDPVKMSRCNAAPEFAALCGKGK